MNDIVYAGKHSLTHFVPQHSHSSWEFIYCTSGSGRQVFGSTTLSYHEGTIVCVPPNLLHANESETGFTNIHVNIDNTPLHYSSPVIFNDDLNHFVLNAFTAAFHHFNKEGNRDPDLLKAYGHLIVAYASSYYKARVHNEIVDEILSNIISNFSNCNYELDKYLHSLPFSYDYVRRLFKSEIGTTPHRYMADLRLQTACEWLTSVENNSANITEISRICGFREPLYFSRMFKKKYGYSPTHYVAIHRGAEMPVETAESIKLFPDAQDEAVTPEDV